MQLIRSTFQLLILALPLILVPNVFNPYEFPKFIFFSVMAELLAIFFALYWFFNKNKKTISLKIDIGVFLVLGFGIVNIISDVFGVNPMVSIFGNTFRHQGLITLLSGIIIVFILHSPPIFKKILPIFRKTIVASALLISLFALWQITQINIFHDYIIPTYNGRVVGTLGNPNFLGGYLAMLLPFILWNRQKMNKLLQLIIASGIILIIFYTDSVASLIAIAFLFIIFLVRLFLKIRLPEIISVIILTLIFLALIGIIVEPISRNLTSNQLSITKSEKRCFENWPNSYPLKIITDIRKTNSIFFKRDSPCDSRLLIWVTGLNSLSKRPILGFGQDNFGSLMPKSTMYIVDNAHNIFLETAISSGFIGLLFYLAILFYALRKASFDIKMSLLAFIIVGQFNPLSIAQIALFWILLGLSQKEVST